MHLRLAIEHPGFVSRRTVGTNPFQIKSTRLFIFYHSASLFHQNLTSSYLFQLQDFFRAAQTCIRFYEGTAGGPVTSYEDLYSRLHYLEEAKQHIEAVIAEKKSPKGTVNTVFAYLRQRSTTSVKSVGEEPSHLTMSLSELNSHMNTINLQIEVTSFMHQCAVDRGGLGLLRATEGNRLPTLFGNGHVRAEVVVQVNTRLIVDRDLLKLIISCHFGRIKVERRT